MRVMLVPTREVRELFACPNVTALFAALNLHREAYLVVRDGEILGRDQELAADDDLELVPVISGGLNHFPGASGPSMNDGPQIGSAARSITTEIYGPAFRLEGTIRVASHLRLSDVLNESEDFLQMLEMEVTPYLAETPIGMGRHALGLINKNFMAMACETGPEFRGSGLLARSAPTAGDLVVEKVAHRVLLFTASFAINGDVHVVRGADLAQMLTNLRSRFLPLTNVSVLPTLPGADLAAFRRPFVLVNRDQVLTISVSGNENPADDETAGSELAQP